MLNVECLKCVCERERDRRRERESPTHRRQRPHGRFFFIRRVGGRGGQFSQSVQKAEEQRLKTGSGSSALPVAAGRGETSGRESNGGEVGGATAVGLKTNPQHKT